MARLQQYPELSATRLCQQLKEHGYTGGICRPGSSSQGGRPCLKTAHLTLTFAPGECARHYSFRVDPCNVHRPNEKGRVESAVGYICSGFLAGRQLPLRQLLAARETVLLNCGYWTKNRTDPPTAGSTD